MTASRSRSLQARLLGVVLFTTLVAVLVALAAMVAYDLRNYQRAEIADLVTQAELLGRTTAPALTFDDPKMARENLAYLRYRPKIEAAAIYNARGVLFASWAAPGVAADFPQIPGSEGARIAAGKVTVHHRLVENEELLGTVYLRAGSDLTGRLFDYVGLAGLVLAVAMLVALALSARLQRSVMNPILAIAAVAREVVVRKDYSRRAERMSDDEVGILADSFNDMLTVIEQRAGALDSSNRELERQVRERERAEQEILHLNAVLEERVRERTAQYEAANRELEAFCYSVSHDLRAPLRAIDGFSQALLEDAPEGIGEAQRNYLGRIRRATQRMGQLIEDLLELSRISRGELERRPVDLGLLASDVVAELRQRNPERGIETSIWDGLEAEADPRLLRVALENLIGNSWKFTSRRERARIEVGALRDGGRTVFFVRDNGAGFDMQYAGKLFGAFERLHSDSEYSGTGIGLATVQRIVQRHGGRIWADARVDRGATFFFTLDLDPGPPAAGGPAAPEEGAPRA